MMQQDKTNTTDFLHDLGVLALGSRLKRLSDRLNAEVHGLYEGHGVDFEPRWFPVYRLLLLREAITVGEAAEALGLSHAAVSQVITAMTQRGLVTRKKDAEDERRKVITLNRRGKALADKLEKVWSAIELALRDAMHESGANVLETLHVLENVLASKTLGQRVEARQRDERVCIVDYRSELAEHFKTLNLEWLEKYFHVEPIDREVLWHPEQAILHKGGHILFATLDGLVVGTCALAKQEEDDSFELTKMAVTPMQQGFGVGKKLLLAALDRARAVGAKKVVLVTNSKLERAVALYHRLGFCVTHAGPHPKYTRGDLCMERVLSR